MEHWIISQRCLHQISQFFYTRPQRCFTMNADINSYIWKEAPWKTSLRVVTDNFGQGSNYINGLKNHFVCDDSDTSSVFLLGVNSRGQGAPQSSEYLLFLSFNTTFPCNVQGGTCLLRSRGQPPCPLPPAVSVIAIMKKLTPKPQKWKLRFEIAVWFFFKSKHQ